MSDPQILDNCIRFLAIDAVEQANSGHPGMPMGMATIARVLWQQFLRHNPSNPQWFNRDRFVLSNGHGSMLLYALLHLTGYNLSIEDLKNFRQLHSKTPGHPEYDHTPGVETTTGPLGQGLANAVGMAIAERHLATRFNTADIQLIDHYTYAFCGDGCLMEGISHEVCSFAGTQKLGKLIVFWDNNGISIDGEVKRYWRDDTVKRFQAYHWQVIADVDGHDADAIKQAIEVAQANTEQPTLICCKTHIGFGSPNKANTGMVHGAALGKDEVALTRQQLHWPYAPFEIPAQAYAAWNAIEKGCAIEATWSQQFETYRANYPEQAAIFSRTIKGNLPNNWLEITNQFIKKAACKTDAYATRKSSQQALDEIAPILPELIGGSADLTGSNNTRAKSAKLLDANHPDGNYIEYGVREFGMSAIMNGMALHGGVIPFSGTFLTFYDYAKNAVRLAAMMKQRVIFVYSHDSIGLGEDGPTHQPIEQLPSLRMTPNLHVWRPADHTETFVAWQQSLQTQKPSALLLTRQDVLQHQRTQQQMDAIAQGGYVLRFEKEKIEAILIATGSEVELAMLAATALANDHIDVRVVSMPCCERFKAQSKQYRHSVLPVAVKTKIAIEAAQPDYWWQFVGSEGDVIGIDQFGASAPYKEVYEACGLTVKHICDVVKKKLITTSLNNVMASSI